MGTSTWCQLWRRKGHYRKENGLNFIVTRGAAPSMSMLEQSLDAVKALVNEEVVAQDGL